MTVDGCITSDRLIVMIESTYKLMMCHHRYVLLVNLYLINKVIII